PQPHPTPSSPPFPYTTLFRSTFGPDGVKQRIRHGAAVPAALDGDGDGAKPQADAVEESTLPLPEGTWLPPAAAGVYVEQRLAAGDRKSTRLNSSHQIISYAVF